MDLKIDGLFADRPLGFELFDGLEFSIHHQAELAPRRAREAIDEIEASDQLEQMRYGMLLYETV